MTWGKSLPLSEPLSLHLSSRDFVSCLDCSRGWVEPRGSTVLRLHKGEVPPPPQAQCSAFLPGPVGHHGTGSMWQARKGKSSTPQRAPPSQVPLRGKWALNKTQVKEVCGGALRHLGPPLAGAAGADSWPRDVLGQSRGSQNPCPIPGPQRDCRTSWPDSHCVTQASNLNVLERYSCCCSFNHLFPSPL